MAEGETEDFSVPVAVVSILLTYTYMFCQLIRRLILYSFIFKINSMKRLVTLLFAAALVSAASAQSGYRNRTDSRNDNSYQSSPYSNNDQYGYQDQYPNNDYYNRNSQWNDRNDHDRYYRDRQRMARQRYEYEMMMRRRQAMYHQRIYNSYPYGVNRKPSLQISIGIGGHRY